MSVRIIIDSAADIPSEQATQKGLELVPIRVLFGTAEYLDGVNITHREFYEKLIESDTLPTTSQPSPYDFEKVYKQAVQDGDEAVVITMSSKLSGTYQSAVIAAEAFRGKVFVVDSLNVAIGLRILVEYAIGLRNSGMSASDIAAETENVKGRIKLIALLDTLEYLKRGGRISKAAAIAGGMLSIKPVVGVVDGEVAVLGKARGSKQGNNMLAELVRSSGGVDFDMPLLLGYTGLDDTMLKKYVKDNAELWRNNIGYPEQTAIGATIGTHVGPGVIAAAFFGKKV